MYDYKLSFTCYAILHHSILSLALYNEPLCLLCGGKVDVNNIGFNPAPQDGHLVATRMILENQWRSDEYHLLKLTMPVIVADVVAVIAANGARENSVGKTLDSPHLKIQNKTGFSNPLSQNVIRCYVMSLQQEGRLAN